MARLICFLTVAFLGTMPTTDAYVVTIYDCKEYSRADQDLPARYLEIFDELGGDAIQACAHPNQPDSEHYWRFSAVVEGQLGACVYEQRQVYLAPAHGGDLAWTFWPPSDAVQFSGPRTFMMRRENDCGGHHDPRYALTSGVSEGAFLALVGFWERLSTTEGFDAIAQRTSPDMPGYGSFLDLGDVIDRGAFSDSGIRPLSMRLETDPLCDGTECHMQHYTMRIIRIGESALDEDLYSWTLIVDLVEGEVSLLGLVEFQNSPASEGVE